MPVYKDDNAKTKKGTIPSAIKRTVNIKRN